MDRRSRKWCMGVIIIIISVIFSAVEEVSWLQFKRIGCGKMGECRTSNVVCMVMRVKTNCLGCSEVGALWIPSQRIYV